MKKIKKWQLVIAGILIVLAGFGLSFFYPLLFMNPAETIGRSSIVLTSHYGYHEGL